MSVVKVGNGGAYSYAKDAGYTGTKEEFAKGLKESAEAKANAEASATAAAKSETNAKASADAAVSASNIATAQAKAAQSYAVGGTGTRTGEDTDNAKTYASEAKEARTAAVNASDSASASKTAAAGSEKTATTSANAAATSEKNAKASADKAAVSESNAKTSETNAAESTKAAATSEKNAKTSETAAANAKKDAETAATAAGDSKSAAALSETNAGNSANDALTRANAAETSANNSKASENKATSYAVGGTGTREGEDTDNAKYYASKAAESQKAAATSEANASTDRKKVEEYLNDFRLLDPKSWSDFSILSKRGSGPKMCNIGDIFTETWADGSTSYDLDLRVVDNAKSYIDTTDGTETPGVMLESKWTHPFGVQFSHQQAFLACPDGLPTGTYHFTLGSNWGTNVRKGKTYQFTTTKDVAKGGRISGCYSAPDQNPANWKYYIYNADGITQIDTGSVTEGSEGVDLGTMAYNTHTDGIKLTIGDNTYTVNMNSIQEMAYGHNRWKTSALRQYMNSDKTKGNWWTPQTEFDIAPDQLASKDGLLCGFPKEFLNAVRTVQVITNANNPQDKSEKDITYDQFFPLSLEQTYINKQTIGEGDACEYYKQLNGTSTPWPWYQNTPALVRYAQTNHTSRQYCRLRSAFVSYANYTWSVYSSGSANRNYASYSNSFLLACVI